MEQSMFEKVKRSICFEYRRVIAFVLAFTMIMTNVVTNVNVAFAAETEVESSSAKAVFYMNYENLKDEAEIMLSSGRFGLDNMVFTSRENESLQKKYADLFEDDGTIFEIFPEMDGDVPSGAQLRVFLRSDEKSIKSGELSGKEDVIFLFINRSEQTMDFTAVVDELRTEEIRVPANTEMSLKSQPETEAPETVLPSESEDETAASDVTAAETTDAVDETTEAVIEEVTTEAALEELTTEAAEVEEVTKEATTDAPEVEDETEAPAEEETDAKELELSISRYDIPVVADSDDEEYREDVDLIDDNAKAFMTADVDAATASNANAALKVLKGKAYDAVDMNGTTVRAYVVPLKKLVKDENEDISKKPAQILTAEIDGADGAIVTVDASEGTFPEESYIEAIAPNNEIIKALLDSKLTEDGKVLTKMALYEVHVFDKDGNELVPEKNVKVTFSNIGFNDATVEVYTVKEKENKRAKSVINDYDYGKIENAGYQAEENGESISFDTDTLHTYAVAAYSGIQSGLVISGPTQVGTGETISLIAKLNDLDTSGVTWSSSDKRTASVGETTGEVSGVNAGTVTITAKSDDKTATYTVQVYKGTTAQFYIRLDGQIPSEPGSFAAANYSSAIIIKNALKVGAPFFDKEGIEKNLNVIPTVEEIKNVYPSYDSKTQYIMWYVIKAEGKVWHVDGVALDKRKLNIQYFPGGQDVTGTAPIGGQYYEGEEVRIYGSHAKIDKDIINVDTPLERKGYIFVGWVTSDINGQESIYQIGSKFNMPGTNVELTAKWLPKDDIRFTVEHYKYDKNKNEILTSTDIKTGKTGELVYASKYQNQYAGYKYVDDKASAVITADNSMVLKLYYEPTERYTVTYLPGEHGTFEAQTIGNLVNGEVTPKFSETKETVDDDKKPLGAEGYLFTGWTPTVSSYVTKNVEYVAQWVQTGLFQVWEYYPLQTSGEYGEYLDQFKTILPHGSQLKYTSDAEIKDLDIAGVNEILKSSMTSMQTKHKGAILKSVYMAQQSADGWVPYPAILNSDGTGVSQFQYLSQLKITGNRESRLTIEYLLPAKIHVKYEIENNEGTQEELEKAEKAGYTLGEAPNFLYNGDGKVVEVSDTTKKEKGIVKAAPEGLSGYEVSKVTAGNTEITGSSYAIPTKETTVTISLKKSAFTVTYSNDGVTSGTVPTDNASYSYGSTVTVQAPEGKLTDKNNGEFICWSTDANKKDNYYYPEETFIITGNTTLYPVFLSDVPADKLVSIQFIAGANGSIDGGNKTYHAIKGKAFGLAITSIPNASAAAGYKFGNWKESSEATLYDNSENLQNVYNQKALTKNLTFTANFEKDPTQWATVTFDKGAHGTLSGVTTYEVIVGSKLKEIQVPTINPSEGYVTAVPPWSPNFTEDDVVTQNVTFTAQYMANTKDLKVTGFTEDYSGHSFKVVVNGQIASDKVEYYNPNTKTWSEDSPSFVNVKDSQDWNKEVSVRVIRDGKEIWSDKAVAIINPISATIKVDNISKTYGKKEDPTYSASVSGNIGTDQIAYELHRKNGDENKNDVGDEIYITADYTPNSNYIITVTDGTLTIEPAAGALDISGWKDVYDGKEHTVIVNNESSLPSGTSLEYRVGNGEWSKDKPVFTDANVDGVTVEVKATNKNYTFENKTADVKISPRKVTIKANNISKHFDGTPIVPKEDDYIITIAGVDGVNEKEGLLTSLGHKESLALKTEKEYIKAGKHEGKNQIADGSAGVSIMVGDRDVKNNYTIVIIPGDVEILKADQLKLEISADGYEGLYDAAAHGISNLKLWYLDANDKEVTIDPSDLEKITYKNASGLLRGLFNAAQDDEITFTDAGEYTINVTVQHPDFDKPVSTNVTIKIKKRTISVTSDDGSKPYDGKPLTNPNATITGDGVANGHELKVNITGTITEAGETHNTISSVEIVPGEVTEKNYIINKKEGMLTVTKADGNSISAANVNKTYDGSSHQLAPKAGKENSTIEYSLDGGVTTSSTVPSVKNVGELKVWIRATHPNYKETEWIERTITVTPAEVSIVVKDQTVEYTGEKPDINKLSGEKGTVTGLVEGDTLKVSYEVDREYRGTYDAGNSISIVAYPEENPNYTIKNTPGPLTIIQAVGKNHLTVKGGTYTYDKTQHGLSSHEVTVEGSTLKYALSANAAADEWFDDLSKIDSLINASKEPYTLYVKAVHPNYQDTEVVNAKIKINPAEVTITVGSFKKEYGLEIDDPAFDGIIDGKIYAGDDLNINYHRAEGYEKEKDQVGTPVVITAGYNSNENYTVTIIPGEMIITKAKKGNHITAGDKVSIVYDDQTHTINPVSQDLADATLWYKDSNSDEWSTTMPGYTSVGDYTVDVKATHNNYDDATTVAGITITQRPITVTAASDSKVYDGSPLTNDKFTSVGEVEGHKVTVPVSGTQTNEGNSANSIKQSDVQITKNGKDVTPNYKISVVDGSLTVSPAPLTVEALAQEFVYDGFDHRYNKEITVKDNKGNIVTNATIEYSLTGEDGSWSTKVPTGFKDVPEVGTKYFMHVRATKANYSEGKTVAEITVTPKPINIKVNDKTKIFGKDDPAFDSESNLNKEDEAALGVSYQRQKGDEDKQNITDDITIVALYNNTNRNYNVSMAPGKLTITASSENNVNVTGVNVTYDGKEYTVTTSGTADGSVLQYTEKENPKDSDWMTEAPKYTDAGTYTVYVRATNPNYEVTKVQSGTVTITPKEVSITVDDKSKDYKDPDPDFTGTSEGLVKDGDLGTITYKRKNTVPDNHIDLVGDTIVITADYTENKNYIVSVIEGKLTINPIVDVLKVNAEDYTTTYNGFDQSYPGATATITEGTTIYYSTDKEHWSTTPPSYKDVAGVTEDGTALGYTIYIKAENPNYVIPEPSEIIMYVEPKAVNVKFGEYTKVYKAEDPKFEPEVDGLVETNDMTFIGSRIEADNGRDDVTTADTLIQITALYETNKNYKVNVDNGTLSITPATLPLIVDGRQQVYDGNGYTVAVSGLGELKPQITYAVTDTSISEAPATGWLTEKPAFTNAGSYRIFVKAEMNNYTTVTQFADVVITKRNVTLTAESADKLYDGSALTKQEYAVSAPAGEDGLVANHKVSEAIIEGTITNVGWVPNEVIQESVKIVDSENNLKTENYQVICVPGKLTINKASAESGITINATDESWEYNNETHQYPAATAEGFNDETIKLEYSLDGVNWSKNPPNDFVNVKEDNYPVYIRATSDNFDGYKEITKTVTITPKDVTINVDEFSKKYGENDPTFSGVVSGLIDSDKTGIGEVSYMRRDEYKGIEDAGAKILVTAACSPNPNYKVTVHDNKLTIVPADGNGATVEPGAGEYNGDQHGLGKIEAAQDNSTIWYATSPDAPESEWTKEPPTYTEVGEYPVYIKITNDNYTDYYTESSITVTARKIVVKADSAQKLFDNTALTKNSAQVVDAQERLIKGQTLSGVVVEGSQTAVGIGRNIASQAAITMEDERLRSTVDVTHNYDISYEEGTLEILDNPHGLTINYVYHAGEEGDAAALPATYNADLSFQAQYSINTAEIAGYIADIKIVQGTMPLESVSVTVTYHKDANGNNIPDCTEDRYTVTFLPGEHGSLQGETVFKNILSGITFGESVKVPDTKANSRYRFDGWKDVADGSKGTFDDNTAVTADKTYEAQWLYIGSNSGGGGTTTPGGNGGGDTDHGPGAPGDNTVTIDPEDVPLAGLPDTSTNSGEGSFTTIDDGEVPLAALPKTGNAGAQAAGLMLAISGMLLAAYTALSKKKEEN